MDAAWQKITYLWKSHKTRFVGAIFGLVLLFGIGTSVVNVYAADAIGDATSESYYDKGLNFIAYLAESIAQLATTILISLISILIAIISYDAFSHSTVIDVGWPIVRDAINMFVVLALLVIAIKNLVPGQSDNQRTQTQLLNVLVAVVLMNFSRTLVLLAVDFSQVVTLTFAQAVSDIAAGNFIQLFSIQNNLVTSTSASGISSGATQGGILVGTAMFKVLLVGIAIITMITIIAAFLIRILLIWFLVILAPAAFFAWGIKGAVPQLGQVYSKWMDQFFGMLVFGPVLMFFLWLSLAISTGGDIAGAEGFSAMPDLEVNTLVSSAEPASLLSTIVGILMLLIGVVAAGQVAGSTVGISSVLKRGEGAAKSFAMKGAKYAGYGTLGAMTGGAAVAGLGFAAVAGTTVGVGSAAAGAYGYGKTERGRQSYQNIARKGDDVLASVQNMRLMPAIAGGAIGSLRAATTSKAAQYLGEVGDLQARQGEKSFSALDSNSQLNDIDNASSVIVSATATPAQRAQARAAMKKVVTDKDTEKAYRKKFGDQRADEMMSQMMASVDEVGDDFWSYIEDPKDKKAAKENFFKFKARNLHLVAKGKRGAVLDDADFKIDMLSESAIENDDVWRELGTKEQFVGYDKDGNERRESMQKQIERGQHGTKKLQNFVQGGRVNMARHIDKEGAIIESPQLSESVVQRALASGKAKLDKLSEATIQRFGDTIAKQIEGSIDTISFAGVAAPQRSLMNRALETRALIAGRTDEEYQKNLQARFEMSGKSVVVDDGGNFRNPLAQAAVMRSLKKDITHAGSLESVIATKVRDPQSGEMGDSAVSRQVGEFIRTTYTTPEALQETIQESRKKKGARQTYDAMRVVRASLQSRIREEQAKPDGVKRLDHIEDAEKLERVVRANTLTRFIGE